MKLSAVASRAQRLLEPYRGLWKPSVLKYMAHEVIRPPTRRGADCDRRTALRAGVEWLYRSQDAGAEDGSRCYQINKRWSACYPEVTGYNLYTLFDYAHLTGDEEARARAIRMAEWELTVQLDQGAFQGGYVDHPAKPVVFNTAQVLQGLARAHLETGDERFLRAALGAADWLCDVQDDDGAWRRFCYLDVFRVTDARIAWPLVELGLRIGEGRYVEAGRRSCAYVASRQQENGWFPECDNSVRFERIPVTHTLAYTTEGLIKVGLALEAEPILRAGQKTADAMLDRFEADGVLYGRYDSAWRPARRSSCLTGCAQIAECWALLHQQAGGARYRPAAAKMVDFLINCQDRNNACPGIRGAMAGSHPLTGEYQTSRFPSWATKYFCDAIMVEMGADERA